MSAPLDNVLGMSGSSGDPSGSPSPPSSTPSAPPPQSPGGSGSPSPPTPSQSPAPPAPPTTATPQNSSALPLPSPAAAAAGRAPPAAPSKESPSPPAAKRGANDSGRGKSGSSSSNGSQPVAAIVAGVVIGVLAFGLLMCIAACVCCTKKKKKKKKRPPHMNMPYYTDEHGNVFYANSMPKWQSSAAASGGMWHAPFSPASGDTSGSHGPGGQVPSPGMMPSLGFSKSSFTYEELASATGGFASANVLGQGGFGYVYKGVLPGSGTEVAVKQLKAGSGQGEREFQAEVEIISRVHHRHLVTLVGYCISGSSQRLLVYEYVPNKTLEHHLHGKGVPVMNWPTRLAIALGSAKGLAYLHEDCHPRIIHRDIKAANILLDENFEAKVADFGLAKLTTDTNTHVSTRVMGTFGYLAPEYASSGKLTDKSDVFSFGVMLLELITGKRPVDPTNYMEDSLVDWARPLLAHALSEGGNFDELLDPRLENRVDRLELERMCASAAAAVRHSAKRRPKMKQIVRALEGDASLDDLNEGVKPGQSMMFSSSSEHESGGNYASNINRLRKVAFESSEYSNDYSAISESGEAAATHRQQHH
ncbi:unnamed protein product [Urochloa humidicola]